MNRKAIAARCTLPAIIAAFASVLMVSGGCPDGSLIGLVGDDSNGGFAGGTSRETAVAIDLDERYSVRLQDTGDEHWFKMTTANDGVWDRIEVDVNEVGSGIRASLRVVDSDGVEVASADAVNVGARVLLTHNTLGGTYYICITDYAGTGTGAYSLRVRNLDVNSTPGEPNDTHAEAYNLDEFPVLDISGTIVHMVYHHTTDTYSGDWDWFKFTTWSDSDISFQVSVSESLRFGLELRDPSNLLLGRFQAASPGQTGNIFITSVSAGQELYIGIYGHRISSSDQTATHGDYTLSITLTE
ncbi:MAG: hypothetical protein EA383_05295 [Spirochaetaceae bacterium]|nr:MAG: hypothetical protein EA383_05295 [Spirochaetaceae bacterium]